jgi:hypothetical protein
MFASCGEKITNHKFFATKLQPKIDNQVGTNRSFLRAININQGNFFLAKPGTICIFGFIFFLQPPHDYIFFCSPHELLVATRQHYTLQTSATK